MSIKESLQKLTTRLTEIGYASFYNGMYPLANSPEKWYALKERAIPAIRPCVDLLLLGCTVEISSLDKIVAEAVIELEKIGLFTFEGEGRIRTTGFCLHPIFGLWMFYEIPSGKISVYFGQDSIALITRQLPIVGNSCLDLCSGPGVQALYAAKQGEIVTSVELNPMAADLARVNALMNNLDNRMDIRLGNLYSAVKGKKFDHITANPPLLPFPEELPYPIVGHGGNDGFEVTWRIIDGVAEHLTEKGIAQIIGVGLANAKRGQICFVPKLREKAKEYGLNVVVNITNRFWMRNREDSYFKGMALSSQLYCNRPLDEILDIMEQWIVREDADQYVVYDLMITHGNGNVSVQDMYMGKNNIMWYA